jgi:hypothetical protein
VKRALCRSLSEDPDGETKIAGMFAGLSFDISLTFQVVVCRALNRISVKDDETVAALVGRLKEKDLVCDKFDSSSLLFVVSFTHC